MNAHSKVVDYISFSFPKLFGAIDATSVTEQPAKLTSVNITEAGNCNLRKYGGVRQ